MASKRETALQALFAALQSIVLVPAPVVERNQVEARSIPAAGLISLRDGDPGNPDELLSPRTYIYEHEAEIIVQFQDKDSAVRDAAVDNILQAIGAAVLTDETLAGAVDLVEVQAPEDTLHEDEAEIETIKAVLLPVILHYTTTNPLN